MAFDPLWNPGSSGFAPAAYGRPSEGGFVTREAPAHTEEPTPPAAPEEEEVEEPAEEEALDPSTQGWIRVEDHEAALLQAREEASGAAEEAVRAELDEAIQALRDVTRNLEQGLVDRERLESEVLLGASEDVATLVLELSRRVVGETLALHPRALRNLVTAAMERLPGEGPVKVHVPPEDLHVLQAHLEGEQNVIWVPDAELRNGCRVETELGRVEASLDAAFSALEVAVAEWLEEQRG